MTDLLLINPGGRETIYQSLGEKLTGIEQPLWCRLIAGYCRDIGYSVDILDTGALNLSPNGVISHISINRPRLIGVIVYGHQPNASTQQMASASELCRIIKEHYPEIPIVIAGGHVSALPGLTYNEEYVDHVVCGEGPRAIAYLLEEKKNYPNIIVDYDSKLDLSTDLHGNTWDLLPMDLYRAHNWQCFDGSPRQPYASIYTSLNCPYSCSFCCISAPFGGPGYRTKSWSSVVSEIIQLYEKYGVSTFKIIDEMFILKPSHYLSIAKELAKLPFACDLNIWCYARVDTIKPDELMLLRAAGIRWLCLGIESGSSHVRDGSEKTINETDIHDAVKAIQSAGINVIGNFIFGLPDDTIESMQATLSLAKSLRCEYANFYAAQGYPGSRLFKEVNQEDLPSSWDGYSQHGYNTKPLPTKTLTSEEVLRFRDEAFHIYFEDQEYLDMIEDKFGEYAINEIKEMTSIRLRRKLFEK